ncbi:MAG: hypothetical protein V4719_26510 [Planctomycetota bacterium]
MSPLIRFCLADLESAYKQWGCSNAHAALAACLGKPVSAMRTALEGFGRISGPVQPPMMITGLARLGWEPREDHAAAGDQGDRYPEHGLCRIQLDGPWLSGPNPSKPAAAQKTHWIATKQMDGVCWIFDIRAGEWLAWAEWHGEIVPRLVAATRLANGGFWLSHSWEIRRLLPRGINREQRNQFHA